MHKARHRMDGLACPWALQVTICVIMISSSPVHPKLNGGKFMMEPAEVAGSACQGLQFDTLDWRGLEQSGSKRLLEYGLISSIA